VLIMIVGGLLLYKLREPAGAGGGSQTPPESLRPKEVALRGSA